jgi:hypothetical protein
MPIVTYFSECEILACTKSSNSVITQLLAEVNCKSPVKWLIRDYPITSTKRRGFLFWRSFEVVMYHELYVATIEPEFQVINFYQQHSDSTINTIVRSDVIASYLMGLLASFSRHLSAKQLALSC